MSAALARAVRAACVRASSGAAPLRTAAALLAAAPAQPGGALALFLARGSACSFGARWLSGSAPPASASSSSPAGAAPSAGAAPQQAAAAAAQPAATQMGPIGVEPARGALKTPAPKKADDKCGDPVQDADDEEDDMVPMIDPKTSEWGGPTRGGVMPEPTRFGDWERKGRCTDFT